MKRISIFISLASCWLIASNTLTVAAQVTEKTSAGAGETSLLILTDKGTYITGDILWLKLICGDPYQGTAYVEILDQKNKAIVQTKLLMHNGHAAGSVQLPLSAASNRYQVVAYKEEGKINGNISFAQHNITIINPFIPTSNAADVQVNFPVPHASKQAIQIRLNQITFKPRERVVAELETNMAMDPVTISVYRADSLQQLNGNNSLFFKMQRSTAQFNEHPYQTVAVQALSTEDQRPLGNVPVYLAIPGSHLKLFTALSDSDGVAHVAIKDYYSEGEALPLVLNPSNAKASIVSPFMGRSAANTSEIAIPHSLKNIIEEYTINMQAMQAYFNEELARYLPALVPDTFPFYGEGTYVYKLDDYTRFTTMEEVIREFVKPIYITTRNGRKYPRIFNEDNRDFDEARQLILIDGIPMRDASGLFSLDPLKFKRIDVIPRNFFFGDQLYSGIADFTTYEKEREQVIFDSTLLKVDLSGWQAERRFFSPEYRTEAEIQSRKPDFRTTLYWNPSLPLNKKASAEFYTSDRKGKYLIVVTGVGPSGIIVQSRNYFDVL